MKHAGSLLVLFAVALAGNARTLETPSYKITIEDRSAEGYVGSTDVHYLGVSKKTGESIALVGRTVHAIGKDGVTPSRLIGYEFKNGKTQYFVYTEGCLRVTRAGEVLVDETGKWREEPNQSTTAQRSSRVADR